MLDRPDLEDDREEVEAVGECEWCKEEIMPWDYHYDIEGTLVHDDCILDYLDQYKIYA